MVQREEEMVMGELKEMITEKKILITGAGGFIGSHLANKLKEQGNFVRGVDIKESEWIKDHCHEFLLLDLRKNQNTERVVKGIDYIFNLAANMGGIGYITEIGADILYDNVLINANMLEASKNENIERYFYSSSACIYPTYRQENPDIPALKEEYAYPADPDNFYGWEKIFTEKMCEAYRKDYGLNTIMARFHNIMGPYGTYDGGKEKAPAALCRKIALAKDGDSITIWGDGKQTRSFLYIEDCIRGIEILTESNYPEPLNIGSDRLVTIDELVDIIAKIAGKEIVKIYDVTKPQGVRGRNSDNTKVWNILKWKPEFSLEQGLEVTYKWVEKELRKQKRII